MIYVLACYACVSTSLCPHRDTGLIVSLVSTCVCVALCGRPVVGLLDCGAQSQRLIAVFESEQNPSLRPGMQWRQLMLNPDVVSLFFKVRRSGSGRQDWTGWDGTVQRERTAWGFGVEVQRPV